MSEEEIELFLKSQNQRKGSGSVSNGCIALVELLDASSVRKEGSFGRDMIMKFQKYPNAEA